MTDVATLAPSTMDTPAVATGAVADTPVLPSKTPSSKGGKRSYDTFHTFIARLIKTEGDLCITQEAKDLTNGLIMRIGNSLIKYAVDVVNQSDKKTLSSSAFRCVAQLEYGRSDPAITFADSVLAKFKASTVEGDNSKKAGLVLPPARFKTLIEKYKTSTLNVGGNAHIYLTALVEFIALQVIKTSLAATLADRKRTINDLHFHTALGHSSLSSYMRALGPIYLVPNGLYTNSASRMGLQKDLYKRIKRAQRRTRNRTRKANAESGDADEDADE